MRELLKVEEKASMKELPPRNGDAWRSPTTVRPFLTGFLTGQMGYVSLQVFSLIYPFVFGNLVRDVIKLLPPNAEAIHNYSRLVKFVPKPFVYQVTFTTAQFTIYETLSEKALAGNGGRAIPPYQEAFFGLISGASAASIYYPFHSHLKGRLNGQTWEYRNLFDALYSSIRKDGFLALWKGGSPYVVKQMALNVGAFASYGPALNYLEKSIAPSRFTEAAAVTGAAGISAFFAVACHKSCDLMVLIKNAMSRNAGKNHPLMIFQLLRTGGSFKFFHVDLAKYFPYWVISLTTFEGLRRGIKEVIEEESNRD